MPIYRGFSTKVREKVFKLNDYELIKQDLLNHFNTRKGERVMNPLFGTGLRDFLFEGITEYNIENLKQDLNSSIEIFIPEITVLLLDIIPNSDFNTVALYVNYVVNISQSPDQVTVQFQ